MAVVDETTDPTYRERLAAYVAANGAAKAAVDALSPGPGVADWSERQRAAVAALRRLADASKAYADAVEEATLFPQPNVAEAALFPRPNVAVPAAARVARHVASTRPQPASCTKVDDGWQLSPEVVPFAWEVVCAGCGDDGGPIEVQGETARALRGPYHTKDEALRVATRHGEFPRATRPSP
jgi:hypothetical protein